MAPMSELNGRCSEYRNGGRSDGARRLAALATRQHGVVSLRQLADCGLNRFAIGRLHRAGRLHAIHPRVYAVGHRHLDLRGRLTAAILFAGDGSALSHTTAASHWSLIEVEPKLIHLSTEREVASVRGIRVHHPRRLLVTDHSGLPVTTVARTLVDIAGMLPYSTVRKAVATASFRGLLDPAKARAELRRGRRGSARLRRILEEQLPGLSETMSPLEDRFLELCESAGLPLPLVNRVVEGLKVDAYWPAYGLVVELDGQDAHGNPIAVDTDRTRDLILRNAGLTPIRYSGLQIHRRPEAVVADLRRNLTARGN